MNESPRKSEPELLVATEDQSFGSAVVDAIETTEGAISAERVEPATGGLTQRDTVGADGVIVDDRVAEPVAVIERLTEKADLPVVVLSESDDDTVSRAIEAGATDVFPRTTAGPQYELVIERVVAADSSRGTRSTVEDKTTYKQAYEALFEKISEGLVVHNPDTGEIVDVNERFCEMNGYERSELLGESIGMVLTNADGYGLEAAKEMIRRARTEGPQRFEWRNKHRDGETFPVEVDLTVIELGDAERVLASVQDITERKRREREYEQIFNSVQDAITVHDPNTGEMVDVNDTFCELVGYDRETILEMGTTGISVQAEGYTEDYAEEIIAEVMNEGQKGPYEWMLETNDGERRVTEVVATRGEIGGEERIISTNRDVTERKRREREYEQIFNMAGDGIVIHDPESGEVVDANQQVSNLLGYDRETFVDRPLSEFQAAGEVASGEQAREKIRESVDMGGQEFQWPLETSDGETVWVRARHEAGEIDGERRIVAMLQDITERRRREHEFEQIFNGVQDAIAVFDPDTLEYLDANEAYLEMFGHESVDELRERGVSGLSITEEGYTEQRGRKVHQRVAESGQPEIVEWQGETSGGERLWLEVKVAPAVIGGEQRTISVQRDVTERKRREQRLEVFNRILRHNLRNQLDVIRSHAEELADRTTGDHAERIVAAVDELARIGRRARDVDRILSEDDTLADIDITQTLRETVETVKSTDSNVSVTTEFPEETCLRADEKTVRMAVQSALENALEHAASAVTVAVDDRPDECVITIADDGSGIPEEELTPIEVQTETRLQHGRGLGLWQLRWCVDDLNGELSFETNTGTTVRITVPDRSESDRID